jgi:hypothetical protein
MLDDPQCLNLYSYTRNNPLMYIDPTGEAIELVGNEEQRKKELMALQQAVGSEAGSYLYENKCEDGKYYVGVYNNGPSGKETSFEKLNEVSEVFDQIIKDKEVIRFGVYASTEPLPLDADNRGRDYSLARLNSNGISGDIGGAYWVCVKDPVESIAPIPSEWMSNGKPGENNTGFVTAHEFGHAFYRIFSRDAEWDRGKSNKSAVDLENKSRQLNNRKSPTVISHGAK